MLLQFRASNFMSFKEDVVLDLRASSLHELSAHVTEKGDNRILKTLAIYGANASGKSCLIKALFTYEQFIHNQMFQDGLNMYEDIDLFLNRKLRLAIEPFALESGNNRRIELEMAFFHADKVFQYGFALCDKNIVSEWLLIEKKKIFEREGNTVKASRSMPRKEDVPADRLYLSVLDYFSTGTMKKMVDEIKDYFKNHFHVYFFLTLDTGVKGVDFFMDEHRMIMADDLLRAKVAQYIRDIDTGITDLVVDTISSTSKETGETTTKKVLRTVHTSYDEAGNEAGQVLFDIERESSGTIRFISYILQAIQLLDKGGVFIIDELASRFHPLLSRFFIDLFQQAKNKDAQLIFTTHDASLLHKDQFRRDEIAFIDKNGKGESRLFTLADLKVRSDASFSKDYLNGKYGAIPIIREELNEYRADG